MPFDGNIVAYRRGIGRDDAAEGFLRMGCLDLIHQGTKHAGKDKLFPFIPIRSL
jgi:hypothetical protein